MRYCIVHNPLLLQPLGHWFTFIFRTHEHHAVEDFVVKVLSDSRGSCLWLLPCFPLCTSIIAHSWWLVKRFFKFFFGFHSAQSLNSHTLGIWFTLVYRITERPCGRKSLSAWSYMVNLQPPTSSWLPYLFLTLSLQHTRCFLSRGFLTFFKNFFLGAKHLPLWEFTNLVLLTLLSIPQIPLDVNTFGKNKKIIILRKTLDKNAGDVV